MGPRLGTKYTNLINGIEMDLQGGKIYCNLIDEDHDLSPKCYNIRIWF